MSEMIENNENVVEENEVVNDVICEDCEGEHETEDCGAKNAIWGGIGHEIPSKFYQIYNGGKILYDDESLYYGFINEEVSTVAVESSYEKVANKFEGIAKYETIKVTVTVNEVLAEQNPLAHVFVDGKEYDLNFLKSPVEFFMNKDHKISIHWTEDMVETFRFVATK